MQYRLFYSLKFFVLLACGHSACVFSLTLAIRRGRLWSWRPIPSYWLNVCQREREKGIAEVFALSSALLSYSRFPPRPRSSSCSTYCQVSLSRVLALPHRRAATCYSHVPAATSHHGVEPWPHNTPVGGPPPSLHHLGSPDFLLHRSSLFWNVFFTYSLS